jgi:putative PEP-CTERM system TPR-repeat lipoprotein
MLASISATSGSAAAQAQMDQWLESRPNDEQLLNLAALLHAGQREFDDARASLRRALEIGKNDPATLLNAARIEVAAGEHDVAATHLEQILKSNPANQQAQLGLARLDLQAGDLESAALRLQIINKADPTAVDSRLLLAKVQMQLKRVGDADQTLQQAVAAAAGRADVLNAIGLLYLEVGRYDEAAARFRQTIAADTQQLAYRVNLARAQLALGQAVAARATLEEALKAQPNALEPSAALVLIDLRERRHAAAIERVERLKTARPNDPKVRLLEGDLHMALGRHSDAADAYSAVARVRPSSTVALKSYHARRMAGLKDATVPLESWIAQRPQDLFVRAALADAYQQAGKADLAIEQYEVLTNGPGANPITLNNLAWLYYEQDDARAELTAKRAYDLAPGNPAVADTYGWILVEKGKLAEGARILEQALLDADNAPDIGYHYAAALARLGDVAAARKRLSSLVVRPEAFASQKDARQLLDKLSAE